MTLSDKLRGVKEPTGPSYALRPELLLHNNIPKPMHGVAPRVVLGQKWWDRERRECYERAEFFCQACGVHKLRAKYHQWLEAHECYDVDWAKGRMKYAECVALCHFCHNYIHSGRLQALLEKGEIHHHKFAAIRQHGDGVLAAAGLAKESYDVRDARIKKMVMNGQVAEWGKWRLVIGRKTYKPLYPTKEAWEAAMAKKIMGED